MPYALVTGGARGIGRAICIQLAKQGYDILVNYRSNEEAALETIKLIKENSDKKGMHLPFDVSDKAAVDKALTHWKEEHKDDHIEILVNNAGIRSDALMMWMKDEQWDNVIHTSLNGFFYVTRRVIDEMITKKYGRVINIVSVSGLVGVPGQTNYSASRAGIIGATRSLAQEVARRNITVNAVAPGFIKTDMTADLNEKELKKLIPMRRFGDAKEVAHLVGFLASRNASYISGEVISITGGLGH